MPMPVTPEIGRRAGGSAVGRLQHRSRTGVAGIRFEWLARQHCVVLVVSATWNEAGKGRRTSFSTEVHGLEGALDRAITARSASGAPAPDRDQLLNKLKEEYETRGNSIRVDE